MDTTNTWAHGHVYRAQLFHCVGNPKEALRELGVAADILQKTPAKGESGPTNKINGQTDSKDSLHGGGGELASVTLTAVCLQALGDFKGAVGYFKKALLLDQESCCWYQREVCLYMWSRLDKPLSTYSIDDEIDPRIKDGWCRRSSWRQIVKSLATQTGRHASSVPAPQRYAPLAQPKDILGLEKLQLLNTTNIATANDSTAHKNAIKCLLTITAPIGGWMQIQCTGFIPNKRQVLDTSNLIFNL